MLVGLSVDDAVAAVVGLPEISAEGAGVVKIPPPGTHPVGKLVGILTSPIVVAWGAVGDLDAPDDGDLGELTAGLAVRPPETSAVGVTVSSSSHGYRDSGAPLEGLLPVDRDVVAVTVGADEGANEAST